MYNNNNNIFFTCSKVEIEDIKSEPIYTVDDEEVMPEYVEIAEPEVTHIPGTNEKIYS